MHDNTHTVRLNSAARVPYRKNKERVTHQLKEYCSVNISVETKVKRVINQSRGGKKTKRCTVCLRYTVLYTYRFLRVMVKDVFAKDLYHITCFVFFIFDIAFVLLRRMCMVFYMYEKRMMIMCLSCGRSMACIFVNPPDDVIRVVNKTKRLLTFVATILFIFLRRHKNFLDHDDHERSPTLPTCS